MIKNKTLFGIITLCLLILLACNVHNTDVINDNPDSTTNTNLESTDSSIGNSEETVDVKNESGNNTTSKTNEELMLEGGKLLLNTALDIVEHQRIKDSINRATKEKMFAYQIGLKYKEQDAFDAYRKLSDANISNIYVFRVGRKEYYVVKFEAKGKEELKTSYGDFKSQLGNNGTEGIEIINLMDFCSKKETIFRLNESDSGTEIKCLNCN